MEKITINNFYTKGCNQTSGGYIANYYTIPGHFGIASYINLTSDWGSTGGGRYYGGTSINNAGSSGGGSSFISGYNGCDAIDIQSTSDNIIHTGKPYHYPGYVFTEMVMKAGSEEMPTAFWYINR